MKLTRNEKAYPYQYIVLSQLFVYPRTRTIDSGCRLVSVDVTRKLNKVVLILLETTVCGPAQRICHSLPETSRREKQKQKSMLDFLSRKVQLAKALLARPYTMHPLRNAFDGIPFGSNTHGVFAATTDDHQIYTPLRLG